MARNKVNPVMQADAMSADEEKQMAEMKAQDNVVPDEAQEVIEENKSEPKQEAKPDIKEEEKQKTVPHEALEAERQRRKAAEKEREELRLEQAKANERLKLINEMLEKQNQPKKAEAPDPDKDALGALKASTEEIRMLKEFKANYEAAEQQKSRLNELGNTAANLERQFMATVPDYQEASSYLLNSRLNELQALGINEQQARQQIMQETIAMANHGLQTGKNPAEMVYNIAKLRGYAPKTAEAIKQNVNANEKLANVAQGQRANQSLTDIAGNSASSNKPIDAKDLANMSEAQFAKVMATLDSDTLKATFGN